MLFLAKGIFSILLLSGAIWLLDWEALKTAFQRLGLLPFIVVIVLTTLTHIILGLRWNLLIRKIAVLPAYQHVRQYLLANFFNSFTPAEIGGDVYRYVALRKTADTSRQLITVLIKERAIGAMIYGAIYIVCLILFYLQSPDIFDGEGFVLFGIGAVILFGLIAFYPSIYLLKWVENKIPSRNDKIKKIISMSQEVFILGDLKTIFAIILLSVVSAVLWIVSVKIVAIDLGSPVSIFALAVLAIVVVVLPQKVGPLL